MMSEPKPFPFAGGVDAPTSLSGQPDDRSSSLKLRQAELTDEMVVRAAHVRLAEEDFTFALGLHSDMSWAEYLECLEQRRLGVLLDEGDVPATFLLADVGGGMVGRTSIRHRLNDRYRHGFGHIGYAVLPEFRGHGYATQILKASLVLASELGIESALLVCDERNLASISVIDRNGGRLESTQMFEGITVRRYWIDL